MRDSSPDLETSLAPLSHELPLEPPALPLDYPTVGTFLVTPQTLALLEEYRRLLQQLHRSTTASPPPPSPPPKTFPVRHLDKFLFGAACCYLLVVVAWLAAQRNFYGLFSRPDSSDTEFIAYLQRSLTALEREETPAAPLAISPNSQPPIITAVDQERRPLVEPIPVLPPRQLPHPRSTS
ncbi:MAG: hypothetical protein HC890_17690, partial [Chloroflexaceae bacterium]|nr:hypothetical protein [Chloroflexaceae bacterium]